MKTKLLELHEQRLAGGQREAGRAILRGDAGQLPMREFELREKQDGTGGTKLNFTGFASVTDQPYEMQDWLGSYTEVVRSGAFKTTLAQNPDTMFLLNHGGLTMARTQAGTLRLDERMPSAGQVGGLWVDADLDPRRNDVNDMRIAVDNGEINEMSFAFMVTRQEWSPDYEQRDITEVNIDGGDVSAVNKGANPHTNGLVSLRSMLSPRALANLTGALREGRALTAQQNAALTRVLNALAMADSHIDASLEDLSSFLGVPNPDEDADGNDGDEGAGSGMESESAAALEEARALLAVDLYDIDRRK